MNGRRDGRKEDILTQVLGSSGHWVIWYVSEKACEYECVCFPFLK